MKIISNYKHQIAFHCESGSVRNLLAYNNFNIPESLIFGIGSGVVFAYLINTKAISGFPIIAIRFPMGTIFKNTEKLIGIKFTKKRFKNVKTGIKYIKTLIDNNIPCAICVDMFYMKYLPPFMHIHVPFHFIVIVGYDDEKNFYVSDAYHQEIAKLNEEHLIAGWETNSRLAMDRYLAFVDEIKRDEEINWKRAIKKAIIRTCESMSPPFPLNKFLPIIGVEGIRFFANQMKKWTNRYSGLPLREGILMTPTILEEQGTGGGAFRFLYAAFLNEAANKLNCEELRNFSKEMTEIANKWRDASRFLIKIGRQIPIKNEEYNNWIKENKKILDDHLNEASQMFIEIAELEKKFFLNLKKFIYSL